MKKCFCVPNEYSIQSFVPWSPFLWTLDFQVQYCSPVHVTLKQLLQILLFFISKMGWSFPQVAADDLDQGQNGQVTYSIRSSSMSGLFKIDPLTGSITTAAIMDREIWTQTKWVLLLCPLFFSLSIITSCHLAFHSSSLPSKRRCLMFVSVIMSIPSSKYPPV